MKRIVLIVTLLFLIPIGGIASGAIITIHPDTYLGNEPAWGPPNPDVIGNEKWFDISRTEIEWGTDSLIIDIYSRYFDNIGVLGTQPTSPFFYVDGSEYAGVLGNENPMSGTLYILDAFPGGIVTSDDRFGGSGMNYRLNERVGYNPQPGQNPVWLAYWEIFKGGEESDLDDYVRFTISRGFLGDKFWLEYSSADCANDANRFLAENPAPVPEPATVLLLSTGLIGLLGVARRKNRSVG